MFIFGQSEFLVAQPFIRKVLSEHNFELTKFSLNVFLEKQILL